MRGNRQESEKRALLSAQDDGLPQNEIPDSRGDAGSSCSRGMDGTSGGRQDRAQQCPFPRAGWAWNIPWNLMAAHGLL